MRSPRLRAGRILRIVTGKKGKGLRAAAWAAFAAAHVATIGCYRATPPAADVASAPLRGLDFRAETTLVGALPDERVRTTVYVRNRRSTPVLLSFPISCYGLLRAYDRSARTAPVWEQEREASCPDMTTRLNLMPGEERTVPLADVEVRRVLGDGLSDGTYRFTVVVAPDGQVLEIEAGEKDLQRRAG